MTTVREYYSRALEEGPLEGRLLARGSERYSSVLHQEANWERRKEETELGRAGQFLLCHYIDGYTLLVFHG